MNKKIIIILPIVALLIAVFWIFPQKPPEQNDSLISTTPTLEEIASNTPTTSPTASQTTPISPVGNNSFTITEVAEHDNISSCWTVINGDVYDLTKWIPQHPGGPDKILSICGTDGTSKFVDQHDNAPKQQNILVGFKIGILVN